MNAKRTFLAICAVVGVVVAMGAFLVRPSGARGDALAVRQQAMELLGARIAELRPGSQVLALSNPFTRETGFLDERNQYERAGLRGLREGLGRRSSVTVVFPEIRPDYFTDPQSVVIPPESSTPLSFLMRAASVNELADAHPECRVIVSLIGLPVGVERLKIWEEQDPRSFALLLPDLRVLGPAPRAVEAFQRGKLLAAVVMDSESNAPLVVTASNVLEVLRHQPKVLGY